ncbi:MAG: DUF4282 domain-containing protein [Candidatus Cloacimonadales bacterium]|nr:DUF4282 domain-containing protein [Candidatus Cloacimonadales bacterium]
MEGKKGFLGALFDFSFSEFITPKLIKFLFTLGVILAIIVVLFIMLRFGGFLMIRYSVMSLILLLFVFFIYVIMLRIWLEFIIVVFKIAENTTPRTEKE